VRVIDVSAHVSSVAFAALVILTLGAAIVCVIVTLEVAVQPLAPVTMAV
jgi:hypothetical protein